MKQSIFIIPVLFLCTLFQLYAQTTPQLHLQFNGTIADQSGNGYDAQALGTPPSYTDANCEEALLIRDNASDGLRLDAAVFDQLNDFTVSVFVKLNGYNTSNTLISCANDNQAKELLIGYNSPIDQIADGWHIIINGSFYHLGGQGSLEDMNWHQVVFTRQADLVRLYIDGSPIGFGVTTDDKILDVVTDGAVLGQEQHCVGGCFENNQSWNGLLDELRVFNSVVDIEELNQVLCPDCAGTSHGTAIIDDCGVCLETDDEAFNQSCADCEGTPNGTAVVDDCGVCLQPTDPSFNLSCFDQFNVYIPNVFSPNDDGKNDEFRIFTEAGSVKTIVSFDVYDRWGNQVFAAKNVSVDDNLNWWDAKYKGSELKTGVYIYSIDIAFVNGLVKNYAGDIALLR